LLSAAFMSGLFNYYFEQDTVDSGHLKWKNQIDQTVAKLYVACHAVRSIFHISIFNIGKTIYIPYFHSTMKY